MKLRLLLTLVLLAGLGLAVVATPIAHAATIAVTTTDDELNADGDCSLREAIVSANDDTSQDACTAGSGADTIVLQQAQYVLSLEGAGEDDARTGDLDVSEDVSILGAGMVSTEVDADELDRVFHLRAGTLELSGLTVKNGFSGSALGTGIYAPAGSQSLTLTSVRVTGSNGNAGAVHFSGAGSLTVSRSRIDNNSGAGSSGIVVGSRASARIVDSLISGNTANNSGGGIANFGLSVVVNTTISGNSATRDGGGIYHSGASEPVNGTLHLYNVTVTRNTADSSDDGNDEGGGIFVEDGGLSIYNSIVGNNADNSSAASQHRDCSGPLLSGGYNLIQDTTGCAVGGNPVGNLTGVAPRLAALQDNGGPNATHALLLLSPALDAGDPSGCLDADGARLTTDQRGYARPIDGDGGGRPVCDMGAYEHRSPGTPTPTRTPTRTPLPPTATRTATPTSTPPAGTPRPEQAGTPTPTTPAGAPGGSLTFVPLAQH